MRFQSLKPTKEQKEFVARQLLSDIAKSNNARQGTKKDIFYGFLGEVVVCDMLNKERPVIENKADGGTDINWNGLNIDIKTRVVNITPKELYEVHVSRHQIENSEDKYFLFLFYHPDNDVFYVAGIMTLKGFLCTAGLYKQGDIFNGVRYIENKEDEMYYTQVKNLAVCVIPEVKK